MYQLGTFVLINLSSACGKNAKFAKLPNVQSVCAFTCMHLAATSQLESEQKYLCPLTTFCGKIRARTQRTNYICSSDPSNHALSKAQILDDFGPIQYMSIRNHNRSESSFFCLTVSSFCFILSSRICSILCLRWCKWLARQLLPNAVWHFHTQIFQNTMEISHSIIHMGTKFISMIKYLYLQNPGHLFHCPYKSEWKWTKWCLKVATSCKILTN